MTLDYVCNKGLKMKAEILLGIILDKTCGTLSKLLTVNLPDKQPFKWRQYFTCPKTSLAGDRPPSQPP